MGTLTQMWIITQLLYVNVDPYAILCVYIFFNPKISLCPINIYRLKQKHQLLKHKIVIISNQIRFSHLWNRYFILAGVYINVDTYANYLRNFGSLGNFV